MSKIVIIGGSYAAHSALTTIYKANPNAEVTLVAMNDHSFFSVAAPRLLVQPELFDKTVFPVETFVKKESNGKAKFVHGKAESVDFAANTVTVSTSGETVVLDYDFLVIATGTKSAFNGWKVNESHESTKAAIEDANTKLKTAKTIAVLGAGPTGVESAGEVADFVPKAEVSLYTGAAGPLLSVPSLSAGATKKLEALGVKIINKVRSTSVTSDASGYTVVFDNGETKKFDLVLEATSHTPYSDFVPASAKDEAGWVVTDKHLLVKGTKNVYAYGDIIAGSGKTIVDLKFALTPTFTLVVKSVFFGQGGALKDYKTVSNMLMVPISKKGGEGILFGWHAPNFLVKFVKSKTYMVSNAGEYFHRP